MTSASRLADAVLIVHFLWVLAILVPIPLVVIGAVRGWRWVRKPWFRITHLAMMAIVLVESIVGIACPLTVWEDALRGRAAEMPYDRSFMAYWVGRILFHDYPAWVFTLIYLVIAGVILGLFWWVPLERRRSG